MPTAPKLPRKLAEKIDGRDVYVRDLVNDDLDRVDELSDDFAELRREMAELDEQITETEDRDERTQLRAQSRVLTRRAREMDTVMLGLYIEDKDGEPFDAEILAKVPVRVQTALMTAAAKKIYGDQDPTTGPGASA